MPKRNYSYLKLRCGLMAYVTKASFGIIRCLYTPEAVGGARVVWFKEDQLISASLSIDIPT